MKDINYHTYISLNEFSEPGGIVIFGGSDDRDIPLCELKQAFELNQPLYNRSSNGLTVSDALHYYDELVAPLRPETLFLHIGEADLNQFTVDPAIFDQQYRKLLHHIVETAQRTGDSLRIAVVSLRNPNSDPIIDEMNRHLKYISESEHCDYGDISQKRLWNPKETRDVVSFLYSTGFVRSLKNKRPIFDLLKILFCFE